MQQSVWQNAGWDYSWSGEQVKWPEGFHLLRKGFVLSILILPQQNIRSRIEQILPAQPCLLCGSASRTRIWCHACDATLPYLTTACCPACALPTPQGQLCGHCLSHPRQFDHAVAAFAYAFPVDALIQALKFHEQLVLARSFADALSPRLGTKPDCIIPMPLHPARLRERGFNQARELARQLSMQLGIPLLDVCRRVRDTTPQSSLPWKDRQSNLHHAFSCEQDMSGKHIALVDDVMTTGTSLNELAKSLRQAGAREISVWVIARTLPHSR